MKRVLYIVKAGMYHIVNGERKEGAPPGVRGNLSGVSGNLTGVRGNLSGVRGNLSGVSGNLSDVSGDLTGVRGNLDEAEITAEERKKGINIKDLIKEA